MRSRVIVGLGVLVAGALLGHSIAAFQQDVSLRYRWTKGETLRYQSTQQTVTEISGLPMGTLNVDQTMTQVLRTVVQDVGADGTTTIEQVIDSIKMEMNGPMGKVVYDSASTGASADPSMDAVKGVFSALVGSPFTVVLSPSGTVQKIAGFSEIVTKMFGSVPQGPGGDAMVNALKGAFNEDSMRIMMSQAFGLLPDRGLKPGDSWNNQFSSKVPMLGGLTTSFTATLKGVEGTGADKVARIATTVTMKPDPSVPAAENPMGLTMQMGEGTGEGEILFDVGAGRLLRTTTRTTFPMTMSGSGPDGSPMNMNTKNVSTHTMELIQ